MSQNFDPNGAAEDNTGIFGFPYTLKESKLILIPVPWEGTASYGTGTANGPKAISESSKYVELFDEELGNFYEKGIFIEDANKEIVSIKQKANVQQVNKDSKILNQIVYERVLELLEEEKIVGLIGGEHSISYGSIKAYSEKYPNLCVLQLDAHSDLREQFEGYDYSHASVMHKVITETNINKLVQVGVRGYCEAEHKAIVSSQGKIKAFFDSEIQQSLSMGSSWNDICEKIVSDLSEDIYISFDIDCLDPSLCPNTGTPVPGGLSYQQVIHLFRTIVNRGHKIVGFDLVEVADSENSEFDSNIAANLLYKMCGWTIKSMGSF